MAAGASGTPWRILEAYVAGADKFLARHQLDSFDAFLNERVPRTIRSINPFPVLGKAHGAFRTDIRMYVGGRDGTAIFLEKPTHDDSGAPMLPNEARLRGRTYGSRLLCDVVVEATQDGETTEFVLPRVSFGTLPVMLHSSGCALRGCAPGELRDMGECPFDQGGYFVVDGKEKVVVSQLRLATNRLYVERTDDAADPVAWKAFMRCTMDRGSVFPKTIYWRVRRRANAIRLTCSMLVEIPLFHLFRLLGVESDREILETIVGDDPAAPAATSRALLDFLHGSVVDGSDVLTQADAVERYRRMVEPQRAERLLGLLLDDLLVNVEPDLRTRARYLGFLAQRLARTCMGELLPEDRDSFRSKRIDVAGVLLGDLFRDLYTELRAEALKYVDSQYEIRARHAAAARVNVRKIFDDPPRVFRGDEIVGGGLARSLKGRWGLEKLQFKKIDGIVQDLNRVSYVGYVSHIRRVSAPLDEASALVAPHQLSGSQFGYLCPIESPDGRNIGLLTHLACTCEVTADVDVDVALSALEGRMTPLRDAPPSAGGTRVFANGTLRGVLGPGVAARDVVEDLRARRRSGAIHRHVGVCWRIFEDEVHVTTEGGRATRPLLRAGAMPEDAAAGWDALCASGAVEYVDAAEADQVLIAPGPVGDPGRCSHAELHPAAFLSPYTCTIPFAERNQAARNVFSGAQGRQALGVFATSFPSRMDTHAYVLAHGQRPIVSSRLADLMGVNALPNGENLIVAVACFGGYNQEDSVVVNRAAVERGALAVTAYETVVVHEDTAVDARSNEVRRVVFAPATDKPRFARYDALDGDGLPREGAAIGGDHVLVGTRRVVAAAGRKLVDVREVNVPAGKFASGVVDRVYVDRAPGADDRFCRVRLRQWRLPEMGDKLSSRHGQKGVVGLLVPPEDMPFCAADGLVPDVIVNPHAFPSRMSVAHLLETLLAKRAVASGATAVDGTPFVTRGAPVGSPRDASEVMIDPRGGAMLRADVCVGPTFYYRLKHMTRDKVNYRATGARDALTRQPIHGRADDGGLRIGEMERDVLVAHGAQAFLKEAFVEKADGYDAADGTRVPYAWHVMRHEVAAMGIGVEYADPDAPERPWEPPAEVDAWDDDALPDDE